jgi:general secretion pathway protein D
LNVVGSKLVGFSGAGAGFVAKDGTLTPDGSGGTDLAVNIAMNTTPRKNNAVILSQPNIITTHNKEGKIFVGEQRPVISSYLPDTATGGVNTGTGYRTTVNEKDIGISLTVKPLIGTDGSVQLDIKQEVNDVLRDIVIDGNPQPVIGRRATESFISARSGEIIVLGGLQRTSRSRNTNRLGPIPIIGDLLGTRVREDKRTDLVFFLRPYVLTNTPEDNAPAYKQMEKIPDKALEQVKDALRPGVPPANPQQDQLQEPEKK